VGKEHNGEKIGREGEIIRSRIMEKIRRIG
jgi:hypothetical protein